MSLSLTTFSSGAVIDATAIRSRLTTTETYINEQIAAADRGSAWLKPNHLYRPDFFGAPNPHTTMPSGESYFRSRPSGQENRAFFSYYLNTDGPIPVPGLNITFHLPEAPLSGAGTTYYVKYFCSFYAYEFGGADGNLDGASNLAAYTVLLQDGSTVDRRRHIRKGSQTAALEAGAFYPRSQHSYSAAFAGLSAGAHSIGVGLINVNAGAGNEWKHVIFRQGNCILRYFIR